MQQDRKKDPKRPVGSLIDAILSPEEIAEIRKDLDDVPKCEGCPDREWCDGDCNYPSTKDQNEAQLRQLSRQIASNNVIEFAEDRCTCGGKLEHKYEWLIPWLHEKHIELQCDRCPFHYIHVRPLPGNIFLKPCYTCDKSLKGDFRNKGEVCDNWRFCQEYRRWNDDNDYQVPPMR